MPLLKPEEFAVNYSSLFPGPTQGLGCFELCEQFYTLQQIYNKASPGRFKATLGAHVHQLALQCASKGCSCNELPKELI